MKNKTWIRAGIVLVLLIIAFFIYKSSTGEVEKEVDKAGKAEPIAYEILDDSVQLEEDVNKWLDENKKKEGFFTKKTSKEIFVLISGGTQKTTGYGISLNAVKQENKDLQVEYEIIAPSKSEEVEKKETNPHMLLRVASKDAQVKGKVSPLVETKETKKEEGK